MLIKFKFAFGVTWPQLADMCGMTVAELARVHWRMVDPPETLMPWLLMLQEQVGEG